MSWAVAVDVPGPTTRCTGSTKRISTPSKSRSRSWAVRLRSAFSSRGGDRGGRAGNPRRTTSALAGRAGYEGGPGGGDLGAVRRSSGGGGRTGAVSVVTGGGLDGDAAPVDGRDGCSSRSAASPPEADAPGELVMELRRRRRLCLRPVAPPDGAVGGGRHREAPAPRDGDRRGVPGRGPHPGHRDRQSDRAHRRPAPRGRVGRRHPVGRPSGPTGATIKAFPAGHPQHRSAWRSTAPGAC